MLGGTALYPHPDGSARSSLGGQLPEVRLRFDGDDFFHGPTGVLLRGDNGWVGQVANADELRDVLDLPGFEVTPYTLVGGPSGIHLTPVEAEGGPAVLVAFSDHGAVHMALEEIFASRTRIEWQRKLSALDACCEPVLDLDEVLSHPQIAARRPQRL